MNPALNRSLHIQYNTGNNLARRIIHHQGSIVNHYTLGGAKLGKMLFDRYDNLTYHEQYYGDLVIKDGQPTRILHVDGTVNLNGNSVEYHYHLKDHLGNVRLVIEPDASNNPVVLQANDYYPFGMAYNMNFQSGGGAHQPNKYLYNSKEEQEMPGKWLDYGWRMYDAQLGRFHSVDPHAENYPNASPFAYVENNPISRIDPDGRDWYQHNESGAVKWREGSNAIDGYSNIGTHYTMNLGEGVSITYNQNTPETMVENVLNAGDWSSQINNPELGDCFAHSGIMVSASGATSLGGPHNNEPAANAVDYINSQVNQGHSARVHVARINVATGVAERDGAGVHWVAISSRTTNLLTGQTSSFGFFEPGTGDSEAGTSTDNRLNVGEGGALTGPTAYSRGSFTYRVTAVRRNR